MTETETASNADDVGWVPCTNASRVYIHRYPDGGADLVIAGAESGMAPLSAAARRELAEMLSDEPNVAVVDEPVRRSSRPRKRRETIADLLSAGLLKSADVLTIQRDGQEHSAIVHADGQMETDDGELFNTPSAAAMHALGSRSEPGWDRWHTADNRPVADLRWNLRVREFSVASCSEKTNTEMRRVIGAWVDHRLSINEKPHIKDTAAVMAWLKSRRYAPATIASYQNHLDRWFDTHSTR